MKKISDDTQIQQEEFTFFSHHHISRKLTNGSRMPRGEIIRCEALY